MEECEHFDKVNNPFCSGDRITAKEAEEDYNIEAAEGPPQENQIDAKKNHLPLETLEGLEQRAQALCSLFDALEKQAVNLTSFFDYHKKDAARITLVEIILQNFEINVPNVKLWLCYLQKLIKKIAGDYNGVSYRKFCKNIRGSDRGEEDLYFVLKSEGMSLRLSRYLEAIESIFGANMKRASIVSTREERIDHCEQLNELVGDKYLVKLLTKALLPDEEKKKKARIKGEITPKNEKVQTIKKYIIIKRDEKNHLKEENLKHEVLKFKVHENREIDNRKNIEIQQIDNTRTLDEIPKEEDSNTEVRPNIDEQREEKTQTDIQLVEGIQAVQKPKTEGIIKEVEEALEKKEIPVKKDVKTDVIDILEKVTKDMPNKVVESESKEVGNKSKYIGEMFEDQPKTIQKEEQQATDDNQEEVTMQIGGNEKEERRITNEILNVGKSKLEDIEAKETALKIEDIPEIKANKAELKTVDETKTEKQEIECMKTTEEYPKLDDNMVMKNTLEKIKSSKTILVHKKYENFNKNNAISKADIRENVKKVLIQQRKIKININPRNSATEEKPRWQY